MITAYQSDDHHVCDQQGGGWLGEDQPVRLANAPVPRVNRGNCRRGDYQDITLYCLRDQQGNQ